MARTRTPTLSKEEVRKQMFPEGHDQNVCMARLLCIRQALKLEISGMRMTRKARTGLTIVREEFGISARNAEAALPLYQALLDEHGVVFVCDKPKVA